MGMESMTATLITGAGTLARHLVSILPGKLRTLSRSEAGRESLRQTAGESVSVLAGDVCDPSRLELALRGVERVIHTAALKRIHLCEYDPEEAVRVNVEGTRAVIHACVRAGVKRALFVSSDKACSPSTLYGATKLCGERMWLASNSYNVTEFIAIRYGNVFGSAGSVVPLWREQADRGAIEITDPQATRFSITLQAAGELVVYALEHGAAGRLYVPVLPSYRLEDLARAFGGPVRVVGARAGEKQHEELIGHSESTQTVKEEGHYVIDPTRAPSGSRWSYSSGRNPWMLGVEELRAMIHGA